MILLPKDRPLIEGLNTYYLNITRFIEHFQGEIGSGAISFSSNFVQGVIYFDKDTIINGIMKAADKEIVGDNAINSLIQIAQTNNLSVNVYFIDPARIYFWSHLTDAEMIYKGLSSEFTDLEGLVKKMMAEKLTGYIEVLIGKDQDEAYLLFDQGVLVGGSYSWAKGKIDRSSENYEELLLKARERGAVFNVARVFLGPAREAASVPDKEESVNLLSVLEELLVTVDQRLRETAKLKGDFSVLLKKKFFEKSDVFPFLDPFDAEFQYTGGKILYEGGTPEEEVFKGVIQCLKELLSQLGVENIFEAEFLRLDERYKGDLGRITMKK
jgi:hypothetical protein